MEMRINVKNVDLRDAQERVEDNVKQLRKLSHKAVLAYAGMWGMAYDEAKGMVDRSRKLVHEAEGRGEKLESAAEKRVSQVRKEAKTRMERVESRMDTLQDKLRSRVEKTEDEAENEVERQVERILERLGIPSRERINRLSTEIEMLSRKIDGKFVVEDEALVEEPIPGYNSMTVREVINHLGELTVKELVTVKEYEMAHEERVTILRDIDRRIEAMPIAGYDDLTVEEIEPLLSTLTGVQLYYLARYEAAHEERVTLQRAIEEERNARQETAA